MVQAPAGLSCRPAPFGQAVASAPTRRFVGSLRHFSRSPARRCSPPARPAARRSVPFAGAGQVPPHGGGESRWGAPGGRPRDIRLGQAGGLMRSRTPPPIAWGWRSPILRWTRWPRSPTSTINGARKPAGSPRPTRSSTPASILLAETDRQAQHRLEALKASGLGERGIDLRSSVTRAVLAARDGKAFDPRRSASRGTHAYHAAPLSALPCSRRIVPGVRQGSV
jgi:hypothetical protein